MFTKGFLSEVRRNALRKKIWYKALDSLERGILSISAKIFEFVNSDTLNLQIVKIIDKLREASKCSFVKHLEQYGMERMKIIKSQATFFGYHGAGELLKDRDFIKYLAFLAYNQPIGWRINR